MNSKSTFFPVSPYSSLYFLLPLLIWFFFFFFFFTLPNTLNLAPLLACRLCVTKPSYFEVIASSMPVRLYRNNKVALSSYTVFMHQGSEWQTEQNHRKITRCDEFSHRRTCRLQLCRMYLIQWGHLISDICHHSLWEMQCADLLKVF